jgi:hypothetical protein
MDVIVDDHLLLQVLLGQEPHDLREPDAQIFTTGLWYHRLCRAVSAQAVTGAMSRQLGQASPDIAAGAVRAITELPATIGLFSLRQAAWPMAQLLREGVRLNLLSLEALAAAAHHNGELCLAAVDENPQLVASATARGTPARLVAY